MRQIFLLLLFISLSYFEVLACSCSRSWNDSFSLTAENSEFVALVKVISFDEYLENEVLGYDGKMPYSMTVEIIKKYKGTESRKRIQILGDDGILCRPYLSDFEIDGYYLIAPKPDDDTVNTEYAFFVCRTDYLKVNMTKNKAFGNYSMIRHQIDIKTFERKLENGDWDLEITSSIMCLLILTSIVVRRNKKRNINKPDKTPVS